MQLGWHGWGFLWPFFAAISCVHPHMNFMHRSNRAALDQLDHTPVIAAGMNLRADLGDAFHPPRGFHDDSALGNCPGERLLAIKVPPALECGHRGNRMSMVGDGYDDR